MSKVLDFFAYQMAKERIHPAKLTAKQIDLRRTYYRDQWAKAERDLAELDAMANWVAEQYDAWYHDQ